MTKINLAGIQSPLISKTPRSVFSEWEERASLPPSAFPEGKAVFVDVVHDAENKHQTRQEPAIACKLDNVIIGYIPVCSTIERRINKAWAERGEAMAKLDADTVNHKWKEWERLNNLYNAVRVVRDYIERSLFAEKQGVRAELSNVQWKDNGDLMSVIVAFDVM